MEGDEQVLCMSKRTLSRTLLNALAMGFVCGMGVGVCGTLIAAVAMGCVV